MKIGIIGRGFVGNAINNCFSCDSNYLAKIKIYDINPKLSSHSLEETVNQSEIIFLSVPTPSNTDGSINLEIVDDILSRINKIIKVKNIILLKSTVIPGSTENFLNNYKKLNIVFNPEFLTEKNANEDFLNQSRIILGGYKNDTEIAAKLYRWRFQNKIPIVQTNFQTAELIKYMNNTFLATKVSFMNEMFLIAKKINADWDKALEGFTLDERVGLSHVNVPGHDGKFGFGGSCLPKDIQALIKFSKDLDIDTKVLQAAWSTNLKLRPERDWEKLKGRAVVDKDID